MKYISQRCNIQAFVKSRGQDLYDELSSYWIEGEYNNENIAAYDTTTMAELIDLAKELMAAAKKDLAKHSQPQFEMTVETVNFIKMYEFRRFANELALGKIITIEKSEDVRYYPALMTIEYDLDNTESFSMTFSNAQKPGDTAMVFADLIKTSSSTSRTVSANWSNLTDYSRNKESITNLIQNPLDRTLRAAQANMSSQAFVVDDSGILGRKYDKNADENGSLFMPEQVRIVNNNILFTTDNWDTSALALGNVKYGENGESAYGLVADVLVGNVMLGKQMKIVNESNTVTIDNAGIAIRNANEEDTFKATTDGDVYLKGEVHASKGTIGDLTINEDGSVESPYFRIDKNGGRIGGYEIGEKTLIGESVGLRSGAEDVSTETEEDENPVYAFWAGDNTPEEAPFRVTNTGYVSVSGSINASDMDVAGNITAMSGTLGGLTFDENGIRTSVSNEEDSDGEKLSIKPNGEIVAQDIITTRIGGEGSSSLEFTKTTSTITEEMECEYKVTYDSKYDRKMITVTTKLVGGEKHNLTAAKTFTFKVTYRSGVFHCSRTYSVTVSAGSSSNFIYIPMTVSQTIKHTLKSDDDIELQTNSRWSQEKVSEELVKTIICDGSLISSKSGKYSLGTQKDPWDDIHTTNASGIGSSDIKKKTSIKSLDSQYSKLFDRLNPVSYQFKEGSSGRRHIGLIANEVKSSLLELGIDTKDFAGYCEWMEDDKGTVGCGLRYGEFTALNIYEIQMLKKRISELENILANISHSPT